MNLNVFDVSTGQVIILWDIPKEWTTNDAENYIEDVLEKRVKDCDYMLSNGPYQFSSYEKKE